MKLESKATFQCDHEYCSARITVKASGRMEYEYSDEFPRIEKRGWVTHGLKTFCPKHKGDKP